MSYMEPAMRTVTAREANQSFSKVLAEVENGETIVITKRGKPVAKLVREYGDKRDDPEWQAAYARVLQGLERARELADPDFHLGEITEEDKYGDAPL